MLNPACVCDLCNKKCSVEEVSGCFKDGKYTLFVCENLCYLANKFYALSQGATEQSDEYSISGNQRMSAIRLGESHAYRWASDLITKIVGRGED